MTPRIPTPRSRRSSRCCRPTVRPTSLIVLLDDVGFGASSAFGGPCDHADRRAARRRRADVQPVPHHGAVRAHPRGAAQRPQPPLGRRWGSITETATSAPGNSSLRPNTKAPLAMTLKLNGYSTAQFGKCHEVPVWQSSPMGPFDAWPSGGGGFENFYGFIGGENNQYYPALYDGHDPGRAAGRPPRRATTSPRTWPTGRSTGCAAEGADARQAVLHVLRARRHPRARTTCRRSGPTSTRAGSPTAGTRSASRRSPGRRSSGWSPPTPS